MIPRCPASFAPVLITLRARRSARSCSVGGPSSPSSFLSSSSLGSRAAARSALSLVATVVGGTLALLPPLACGAPVVGGALAIAAVVVTGQSADAPESTTERQVAAKLLSAGLPGQAAELYEAWLQANPETPKRTEIALSLGEAFRQQGDLQKALRWYYEAEESTSNETARAAKEGIVKLGLMFY